MPRALLTSCVHQTAASHTTAEALKEAVQGMEGPMKAQDTDTSSSCSHGAAGARVSNRGTLARPVRGRGLYEKTLELLALVSIMLAKMTTETVRGFRFGRNLSPRTGSADSKGPSRLARAAGGFTSLLVTTAQVPGGGCKLRSRAALKAPACISQNLETRLCGQAQQKHF